jgi:hypothetical protein
MGLGGRVVKKGGKVLEGKKDVKEGENEGSREGRIVGVYQAHGV